MHTDYPPSHILNARPTERETGYTWGFCISSPLREVGAGPEILYLVSVWGLQCARRTGLETFRILGKSGDITEHISLLNI